jgi:hypothetical protein
MVEAAAGILYRDVKKQSELQVMRKDLLKHIVEMARARFHWTILMKDRTKSSYHISTKSGL